MKMKHSEELFDSLIRHAGHEMLGEIADETPSKKEAADQIGGTNDLDKRMQKIINKEDGKRRMRKAGKFALRAAVVLIVILVVSTVAILSSEALRVNFLNMMVTIGERSTDLTINDDADVDVPKNVVVPNYLPEGYKFDEVLQEETGYISFYRNLDNEKLIIEQRQVEVVVSVDNERHEKKKIEIDGKEAYVFYSDESSILVFYTDDNAFTVMGRIDEGEIIRIAESMVK